MENLTEEKALAILITTLKKRKKISNPLPAAEACKYLTSIYGSYKKVAERLEISGEMIREFAYINKLPKEIKNMMRRGLIQGVDILYRIASRINDPKRQIAVAKVIAEEKLSSQVARDVIEYVRKHPRKSVNKCKQEVLKVKGSTIELHVIPIRLPEILYGKLEDEAREKGKRLGDLIRGKIESKLKPKYTVSCDVKASMLILSLRREDFEEVNREARLSETLLEEFITKLLET